VYLEKEVREFLDKAEKKKGWLTQYSRTHNYSSPFRIDEVRAAQTHPRKI